VPAPDRPPGTGARAVVHTVPEERRHEDRFQGVLWTAHLYGEAFRGELPRDVPSGFPPPGVRWEEVGWYAG
jgi:hypothetical protein